MSRARRTRAGGLPREVRAVAPGSWDRAAITAALREWDALVGRAPRAYEWSSTGAASGLGAARWFVEHPRWPSAGTVVYHFGCWSEGLDAAGLPTLIVEHELPRRERVATAVALRAASESVRSIAEQLGVHLRTAHRASGRRLGILVPAREKSLTPAVLEDVRAEFLAGPAIRAAISVWSAGEAGGAVLARARDALRQDRA